jgi:CheY-like chemotaxis protein
MNDAPTTILVVDDDLFTGEMTGMVLEMSGYDTITAVDGRDALERIAATPDIRAVVSDMHMPEMDGIQLFAALRQQGSSRPFVLLTGDAVAPLQAAHPEMDGILTKDENLQTTLPNMLEILLGRA